MKTERNILIAFILNLAFSVFEFVGGILIGSVAIMSDAVHDIGDALSIGLALLLERKSKRPPDTGHTYGYIRYSVLGSLITTVILLIGSLIIIANAISRMITPTEIHYDAMVIFALIGAAVNITAAFFTRDGDSLNQKAVNLHMLEDVLGWIVVLIGAIVMRFTDLAIIDPLLSLGVAAFIFIQAMGNLRTVGDLFLEKTPKGIDIPSLTEHLLRIEGVDEIHHIHVRSLDGIRHCATMHVRICGAASEIKAALRAELNRHGICHATLELEDRNEACLHQGCNLDAVPSTHGRHHHGHHHG